MVPKRVACKSERGSFFRRRRAWPPGSGLATTKGWWTARSAQRLLVFIDLQLPLPEDVLTSFHLKSPTIGPVSLLFLSSKVLGPKRTNMRKVLELSLLALVLAAGAYAQATAGLGSVSGTVRDATGAVIPGATVVVANDGKGIRRTMTSTDAGVFAAPALVPSSGYSITVTKQGFNTYEVKEFDILVGQNVDFRVGMQVGSATTKVDVTAEAPLIEDTKSGVTSTVGEQQIVELPINGRRVDSFVLLTPAVTNDGEFGLISFRGIAAGNSFPHRWQRHHQQLLQRERRPHAHRQPAFAGRGAGIPGAVQRLLGRVRPRHGRRDQHRDQERRATRLTAPATGSSAIARWKPPTATPTAMKAPRMAAHRRRQPRRRGQEGQAVLLRRTSTSPTAISRPSTASSTTP